MSSGITRAQRILLRGSLRCMVVFAPLYLALRVQSCLTGDVLGRTVAVDDLTARGRLPGADQRVHVYESAVRIDLEHADPSLWVSVLVPTSILAVAIALVGFLMLRIFHETDAGRPFFDTSARRLRTVSVVIAVAAVLVPITSRSADTSVLEAALPRLDPAPFDVAPMMVWLMVALVVRIMAEAFRLGAQLRDDTEGLV